MQGCQLQAGLAAWQEQAAAAWLPTITASPTLVPASAQPVQHAWELAAVRLAAVNRLPGSLQGCSAGMSTRRAIKMAENHSKALHGVYSGCLY